MLYLALFALFATVQGRAVNISNTWVLPEEGFPVFYRYFRDRISWYEADAVCQFHHANLVTVDTTAQYDAVRAYLKELDISSAVWVGLIRSNPDGDFTWTDYRGLSGEGYWSSAPDARAAPLCAAADPAADYRWEARACGGPTVASFICELPVPQWALGIEGCMVRELPALTILYLPESAAVQLTADCGLAGVKRVQCTGNVKREDLLRDLSCEEEDSSSTTGTSPMGTTWSATTDTPFTEMTTNEAATEEYVTTEIKNDNNQLTTVKEIPVPAIEKINSSIQDLSVNKLNKVLFPQTINVIRGNNLQSNDIPRLAGNRDLFTEMTAKVEDENLMRHKMLHEEIARRGNLETIFTQPTDHFIPPLVMAKAKISNDMTVLSLEEKHAQKLAEKRLLEHNLDEKSYQKQINVNISKSTTEHPFNADVSDKTLITTIKPIKSKEYTKQNKNKSTPLKKYNEKLNDPKVKNLKPTEIKFNKVVKTVESSTQTENIYLNATKLTSAAVSNNNDSTNSEEDPAIDLTVIIKEPDSDSSEKVFYSNYSSELSKIELKNNTESGLIRTEKDVTNKINSSRLETYVTEATETINVTMNQETIKITIIHDENSNRTPTVFEFTTKSPAFNNVNHYDEHSSTTIRDSVKDTSRSLFSSSGHSTTSQGDTTTTLSEKDLSTTSIPDMRYIEKNNDTIKIISTTDVTLTTVATITTHALSTNNIITNDLKKNSTEDMSLATDISYIEKEKADIFNDTKIEDDHDLNATNMSEVVDGFQSPLLSGANEPLHRPMRSRRPQPPNRLNKFNPFRILG